MTTGPSAPHSSRYALKRAFTSAKGAILINRTPLLQLTVDCDLSRQQLELVPHMSPHPPRRKHESDYQDHSEAPRMPRSVPAGPKASDFGLPPSAYASTPH